MENRWSHPQDRRAAPRLDSELPLKFVGEGFEVTAATRNVSCSGMYCETSRFLPVMTKLAVILFVPLLVNNRKEEYQICCDAVVVRIEPECEQRGPISYRVGCFFSNLAAADREVIARYMEQAFLAARN